MIAAQDIKDAALRVGFDACGIAPAGRFENQEFRLSEWLEKGFHADMRYMENYLPKRMDVEELCPGAKSVISLLVGYKPSRMMTGDAKIAQYAYGEDYHTKLKRMLFALMFELKVLCSDFEGRAFVDTAPISDKLWAKRAGLGWIGKNSLLVNPQLGSYCNIGEIVTETEVDVYDKPMESLCGNCDICLRSCPNGAIVDGLIDTRLCTSYNTIENKSKHLSKDLNRSGYAFGCDCCQLGCPYNRQSVPKIEISEQEISVLEELRNVDEQNFNKFGKGRALNRISFTQWIRNLQQGELSTDH